MDKNVSIISIPDSDTSASGVGLNETFSPKKETKQSVPVTPKREPVDLDATFTPEDKKEASPKNVQNETFSPVKEATPPPPPSSARANRRTPKKQLPESCSTFDSPKATVPDIVVVPPTAERRPLRRSVRTPSKPAVEPVATRASTRRSTRQTPVKAATPVVVDKKRGRRSKKDLDATVETTVPEAEPIIEDVPVEETPTTIAEEEDEAADKTIELLKEIEEEVAPKKMKKEEVVEEPQSTAAEVETVPTECVATEKPNCNGIVDNNEQLTEDEDDPAAEEEENSMEVTQEVHAPMFASEFLLPKSIRKRSLSVADVPAAIPKRNFRVQFHSPGNMEKTITEIDESLYLNFTKSFASSFSIPAVPATKDESAKRKPLRRKRSLSNAETPVEKLATMQFICDKAKKDIAPGSEKKKLPTPSPRKKMPNFAAIHQNIFQQMESLVDFKERKKERAQFLLTAVSPAAPLTLAAKASIVKPVSRGAIGKANLSAAGGVKKASSNLLKPKHRVIGRKPQMAAGNMSEKKLAAILQTADLPIMGNQEEPVEETLKEPEVNVAEPATIVPAKTEEVKENITGGDKASKIKMPRVYNNNKDANIKSKPLTGSTTTRNNVNVKTKETPARATTLPQFPLKTATALAPAPKDPKAALTNSYKIVKGVRMNRRFELMMKHRNTKTTDKN